MSQIEELIDMTVDLCERAPASGATGPVVAQWKQDFQRWYMRPDVQQLLHEHMPEAEGNPIGKHAGPIFRAFGTRAKAELGGAGGGRVMPQLILIIPPLEALIIAGAIYGLGYLSKT